MDRRRTLLTEIPFAAILTTNFDDELQGEVLDGSTYATLLRDAGTRWLERRFWKRSSRVLKLHGDLHRGTGVTLSRRGYRTRLYSEPGYLHVLRSVLLTKTVLFLGFSFTDEYLNELRSEVLSYLARDAETPTLAYALLADVPPVQQAHYRLHERIQVFGYDSHGGRDHGGFDAFLRELHARTNPAAVLGRRLLGKRILWMDPATHRNEPGRQLLARAAEERCTIDTVATPDEAMARLAAGAYDLVLSRWGHTPGGVPDAVTLLERMRRQDVRAPLIIFAWRQHAAENRERALRLGALEYVSTWETLFQLIDRRFGPPPDGE
jgi:CheY-like chemotaxis protein